MSILTALSSLLIPIPAKAQTTNSNPDLGASFCLTAPDLMFILDDSGSVDATERQQQRAAVMTMLNYFVNNNISARAAIVRFSDTKSTVINYTSVTSANLLTFQTALSNNYGQGGLTNWEAGFQQAISLGISAGSPDVTFFFTDGTINNGGSPNDEANQLRQVGSHIYGIAIQDPALTITEFQGVTDGTNTLQFNGSNSNTADYVPVTDFSTLGASMTSLVSAMCPQGGSISGTLYQDGDGNNTLGSGETRLPANIDVQLRNSSGTVISTVTTDSNGNYTFPYVSPGSNYQIQAVTSDPQIPTGMTMGTTNPITGITISADTTIANQNFGFDLLDYGDTPTDLSSIDATLTNIYPSAWHSLDSTTFLGAGVSSEASSVPSVNANTDTNDDGVTFPKAGSTDVMLVGQTNSLTINASKTGTLSAWIDWNQDGDWNDTGERIANNVALIAGNNTLSVPVANTVKHGSTYARFRFSSQTNLTPTGAATNGEVEDYKISVANPEVSACIPYLIDGGFETSTTTSFTIEPETQVQGWSTVANSPTDGISFNERHNIETWTTGFNSVPSFQGTKFAELNADVPGMLHQDMVVTPGTTIYWSFAHRGRAGNDTVQVMIGAPGAEIEQNRFTTPNTTWKVYSGRYLVPAGQNIIRLGFKALSAAGGISVGNFIDNVNITPTCPSTLTGFKSVKLTTDADGSGSITPGDTVTYTIQYANLGPGNTGGLQINDQLPSGLTITSTGAQTVTVTGTNSLGIKNPAYTGAAAGAVSNLLDSGSFLVNGGTITVTIPARINLGVSGPAVANQATTISNEVTTPVLSDNAGQTTDLGTLGSAPYSLVVPAASVAQTIRAQVDPTTFSMSANVLLVKRITAINGNRLNNPNDSTPLNGVVDDTTSARRLDDNNPGWPTGYLLGAIDGGKVKPGDEIEYTIYFLNAGGANASKARICDRITGNQSFQASKYAANTGMRLLMGPTTGTPIDLTNGNDGSDRGQYVATSTSPPTNCYLPAFPGGTDKGMTILDLTGTSNPNLSSIPYATGAGTPNNSYGFWRFTTKVDVSP